MTTPTVSLLCCATGPREQVATSLALLRAVVDEAVVCAGRDVDPAAYAGLADRGTSRTAPRPEP